jgi:hypothetical protein
MMFVLSDGLRYYQKTIPVGAQTERRGDAWAGGGLASR